MAESAHSDTTNHKADTRPGGSEAEEWVRADRRPQTSQPWLQQRSGASSVTQSTKRKTEVFVVRTRQRRKGRDEEKDFGARRERYEGRSKIREGREVRDGEGEVKVDGRNPGRRRRRKQRDREHDKEKEGELKVAGGRERRGERGERDESNSSAGNPNRGERCKAGLKKTEGEVGQEEGTASKRQGENRDQVTKTNSCQRYDRSREKPCDSDQRERGRRDKKGMESWQEEATRVQSDKLNLGVREVVRSRNHAKREKRELQGMQRREKEQSVENGVHAEQDNSNAEGIGLKRTQDERVDRNWRLESKEKEPPLLSSAEKEEKVVPDQERGERRSKKCGSMPKKAKNVKPVTPTLQSSELTQQLSAGSYSCMVCCDRVHGRDAVWSCRGCYHVFHLECIRKWATSPASLLNDKDPMEGWRCPACQKGSLVVPTLYKCYCGKLTNPRPRSKGDLTAPHSCGDLCGQNLAKTPQSSCQHKCQLLCHPGPCPPCPVMVTRSCPCGRRSYQVRCSKIGDMPPCESLCGKKLSCGRHQCDSTCHSGPCPMCQLVLTLKCYCGRSQRDVVCSEHNEDSYQCDRPCGKELNCGNHLCELTCHPLPCPACELLPSNVTSCPCGATPLSLLLSPDQSRTSCLDPVPTCRQSCGKKLSCSTRAEPHFCAAPCHEGPCPPCEKSRVVWCRCGKGNIRVECVEMEGMGEYVCEKTCNKMKTCGRHRCNNRCCMDSAHQCDLLCGKRLQCGKHFCTEPCHKGHCDQCWEYSYDELMCHCGATVIYPPVACGTRPPACNMLCARMHACDHPVTHSCHCEEECPPCTFLTVKMCMGEHEERHNIPCHITDVSCGKACDKQLPCKKHKCQKTCHRGVCMDSALQCKQPCQITRKYCSHKCSKPCHVGSECPDTPCKAEVRLTCKCGRRKERLVCGASSTGVMQQAFHKMLSKDLGAKIRDLQNGQSVSIGHVTLASLGKEGESLDCDEVCAQEERNRVLASALGIANPVISPLDPALPRYSGTLMELARRDPEFTSLVEEELRAFVEMVMKGSTLQVRLHEFPPMSNKERKLIHELAPHYGCNSLSYDTEPQRYTTVSTKKSNAKVPTASLTTMLGLTKAAPSPVNLPPEKRGTERGPLPLKLPPEGSEIS